MDDMTAKIKEILSDKESMKQLNELAQMFASSNESQDDVSCNDNNSSASFSASDSASETGNNSFEMPDFDISKLMKIQEVMSKTENDKNADLLVALKPLLKKERQERVDKAVKILKLLAVWNVLKESGLLNDFL